MNGAYHLPVRRIVPTSVLTQEHLALQPGVHRAKDEIDKLIVSVRFPDAVILQPQATPSQIMVNRDVRFLMRVDPDEFVS